MSRSQGNDAVAIHHLRAILCEVSNQRASELLEAASGSIERAVEIHFQQQHLPQEDAATGGAADDDDDDNDDDVSDNAIIEIADDENDTETVKATGNEKDEATSGPLTPVPPAAKKARTRSSPKSPDTTSNKQGTLDMFLGLPPKQESPGGQPTIDSFFGAKQPKIDDNKAVSTQSKSIAEGDLLLVDKSASANVSHENGPLGSRIASKIPEESQHNPPTAANSINNNVPEPSSKKRSASPKNKNVKQIPPVKTVVDPRLTFAVLARAFTEMTGTTKRHAKLNALKTVLVDVIQALGGIHDDSNNTVDSSNNNAKKRRQDDGRMLTCTLELISGKISLEDGSRDSEQVSPVPLQVSGAAVSTAVQTVTGGASKSRMREVYRRTGDLGDTAAEFFSPGYSVKNFFVARKKDSNDGNVKSNNSPKAQSTTGASIARIHELLREIATVSPGIGSQKERQILLVKLLRLCTSKEEMRFLVRILIGNMRLGATMKSILAALAMAVAEVHSGKTATPQEPSIQRVQKTFDICPRLNKLAWSLICGGIEKMEKECTLEVGCPIQPMLANPAHSLAEVEKLMTKTTPNLSSFSDDNDTTATTSMAVAEWKYDGMRCQAHFDGQKVTLFSRHLLDNTNQFPDAAKYLLEARKDKNQVTSFIIDAEIVGVANTGEKGKQIARLLPFQVLSTRRGAKGSEDGNTVQIRVFAFDLMYLNGESLLQMPLWERQSLLQQYFRATDGFAFASSLELSIFDEKQITAYLQEAVEGGAEGLMVKLTGKVTNTKRPENITSSLSCPYESGTRSQTWLKVKRDYVSGFADTIDVVPIGAWYGQGRKAEKGFLSPILFAIYDEDDGVFRSISRCLSFTDEMFTAIREFYIKGTPYPSHVGLSSNSTEEAGDKETALTEMIKDEANDCDADGIQEKHEIHDSGITDEKDDSDEDDSVGVNCFPGRPSSSVYVTNENPTIWFKPCEVWEVSFADLTLSRTHTAAAGLVNDPECRGVALRFPRFKRRRPDKGIEQATTSVQISELFTKQFKQG